MDEYVSWNKKDEGLKGEKKTWRRRITAIIVEEGGGGKIEDIERKVKKGKKNERKGIMVKIGV